MSIERRRSLEESLALRYPFNVIADPDGAYLVEFPDLPGCFAQVARLEDVSPAAADAFRAWMHSAYNQGFDISLPSYPEEYSGKLHVRLPRSLHRELAEQARHDGVSLNTHIVRLLSERNMQARFQRQLEDIAVNMSQIKGRFEYSDFWTQRATGYRSGPRGTRCLQVVGA